MTDDTHQTLDEFGQEEEDTEPADEPINPILVETYPPDGEEEASDDPDTTVEQRVLDAFRHEVDPKLVDAGWGFEPAKSVEFGYTDQSLVNHVRNGVAALARVNEVIESFGGVQLDESDLRDAVALFTIHDIHKLDRERDATAEERFDIPLSEVNEYVDRFGLDEWTESLSSDDFRACAVDHHDEWTSNHDVATPRFDQLRPLIRLADALASSATPEDAASRNVLDAITAAYPNAAGNVDLRYHTLDDVKGILTNLLNASLADTLESSGYRSLLIYQDGCVYLAPADEDPPTADGPFVDRVFGELKRNVRESHTAYKEPGQLAENLAVRSQNFYGINDQDFFYAGAGTVLEAVTLKATRDADPGSDPTDAMADTMAGMEEHLPFDVERTREPVGLARLVHTVKRSFVEPVLEATDAETTALEATCRVFGVSEAVHSGITTAADELSLTAGGKWDHAYGIAQALLNENCTDPDDLARRVATGLGELHDDWQEIVEADRTANLESELGAYLRDVIAVDGRPVTDDADDEQTDPFEEYPGKRRGKTCVICNRGTTGTKGDMEAPKSLTTLKAGYSNDVAIDAGKPEELLACYPCQVEFSLRETGSSRRDDDRLWVHLVPDYFYTPLSWRQYKSFFDNFSADAKAELGQIAASVLHVGDGGIDPTDSPGRDAETVLGSYLDGFLDTDHGRSLVETLDQGFEATSGYGAVTFGYFKPKDNDTEFQFFGVFTGLALAAYAGLRVVVSESPIPDVRGRDFQSFARVGGGFSQVHDFYGTEIPLSELRSRLNAAAALIRLGYENERDDTLFAKYLRATRNKPLPGSYLLKRLAQADDGSDARYLLEEARVLDEETSGIDSRSTN